MIVDLLKPETFRKAAGTIRKADGRLDILINNAGIAIDWDNQADDVPIEKLRQTFEVNFFGMVEFTQTMLPLLRASDAGRIVNQSSRHGSLGLHSTRGSDMDDLKAFSYGSSKTAINAFTVHLAHALLDSSIKVNSAHPGVYPPTLMRPLPAGLIPLKCWIRPKGQRPPLTWQPYRLMDLRGILSLRGIPAMVVSYRPLDQSAYLYFF